MRARVGTEAGTGTGAGVEEVLDAAFAVALIEAGRGEGTGGQAEEGAEKIVCSLAMVDPRSIGPDRNIEEEEEDEDEEEVAVEVEVVAAMPGFSSLRYTSLHTSFAQYL